METKGPTKQRNMTSQLNQDPDISEKDLINTHRLKKQQTRNKILKERKVSSFPIGIEARPYYNREKKAGLVKVILVTLTNSSGTISRKLIGKNIPMDKLSKLLGHSQIPGKGQGAKQYNFDTEILKKFTELYQQKFNKNKKIIW